MAPIRLRRGLLAGASMIVLGTFGYGRSSYAACNIGAPPNVICSGVNFAGQTVAYDNATVTTAPGFSVSTAAGNALLISGQGNISFTDTNKSTLFTSSMGGSGLLITSLAAAPGSVTVSTNGQVIGFNGYGIYAANASTGGNLSITTGAGAIVGGDVGMNLYDGIHAFNQGSAANLSISIGSGGVYGSQDGISAVNNGSGAVAIDATGAIVGDHGNAIYAVNLGTSMSITTGAGTIYGYYIGLNANNLGSGSLSIATGSGNIYAFRYEGIFAYNSGTSLSITTGAGYVNGGTYGIRAINEGSGDLSITTGSGYILGYDADGISARNAPSGENLSIVTGQGDVIGYGGQGINATSYGTGNLSITTGAGAIYGYNGDGIRATNYGLGSLSVTAGAGGVLGLFDGIYASNFGYGDLTVTTGSGDIKAYTGTYPTGTRSNGVGINAWNYKSGANLTVTTGSGDVTGQYDGIQAINLGSGHLTVTTGTGSVLGLHGAGYYVFGHGINAWDYYGTGITIETQGFVGGYFNGINAVNSGYGGVSVTSGAGGAYGYLGAGIFALNYHGGYGAQQTTFLEITTGSGEVYGFQTGAFGYSNGTGDITITTGSGNVVGLMSHGIIANHYGSGRVTVNTGSGAVVGGVAGILVINYGGYEGQINVGGLVSNTALDRMAVAIDTDGEASAIDISGAGKVVGTLTLTDYEDHVVNRGLWLTGGNNYFNNGADYLDNRGLLRVTDSQGSSETTSLFSVDQMVNRGLIDMSDEVTGNGVMSHDQLFVEGDFDGQGGSLRIDAFLAGDGNSSADLLSISGAASGVTVVSLVNTNAMGGEFNSVGIDVVNASGGSSDGVFKLQNDGYVAGAYVYRMRHDGSGLFQLFSEEFTDISDLPGLVGAANAIFGESSDILDGRLDEREQVALGESLLSRQSASLEQQAWVEPAPPQDGIGFWMEGLGRHIDRDATQSIGGMTVDSGYEQSVGGFLAGVDINLETTVPGTAVVGIMAGYLFSNQEFNSGSEADYHGPTFGLYGAYVYEGFYTEATFKADLLDFSYDPATLSSQDSGEVTTVGARVESDYRFDLGESYYIEPNVGLSYVLTKLSNGTLANAEFEGDGHSLRGSIGARIGGLFRSEELGIEPSINLRLSDEFAGDANARLFGSGVTATEANDDLTGTLGEITLGVQVFDLSGEWSGYVEGVGKFGDGYTSLGGSVGLRLAM